MTSICLTERQKQILEHWVRSGTSPQRLVFRCKILLLRSENKSINAIMCQLGCSREPVRKWIGRFEDISEDLRRLEVLDNVPHRVYCQRILEVLSDAPRTGAPHNFTAEQVVQIIAVTCEVLDDSDAPLAEHPY